MDRLILAAALLVGLAACSSPSDAPQKGRVENAPGSGGAATKGGGTGETPPNLALDGGTPDSGSSECASVAETAKAVSRPVDIIFVIDNSGSMSEEIGSVKERINADFAQIIRNAGVDYRVIMISLSVPLASEQFADWPDADPSFIEDFAVCVRAPLGQTDCVTDQGVNSLENPPAFFHYSMMINSTDAWCKLMDGWATPDELGRGNGWSEHLRPNAFKNFVIISDDASACQTARDGFTFDEFDVGGSTGGWFPTREGNPELAKATAADFASKFQALSPEQFGTATERRFRFHSIVGLTANSPESEPWPASAPLQTETCGNGAENAGLAHQELSILTGGLRYPLCRYDDFSAMFRAIAASVVNESRLSCEWQIPRPKANESLDYGKVNLEYRANGAAESQIIAKVADAAACNSDGGWHYDRDQNPEKIVVCPSTCQTLQTTNDAEVRIAFGCETKTPVK